MYTVVVVPGPGMAPRDKVRLAPGETLRFGREAVGGAPAGACLGIPHEGVSRAAGEITATDTYWSLSNLSRTATYAVENPEGAGEHIKVAPGRLAAPVAFEFARVVLPAGHELVSFDVWAPRHDYAAPDEAGRRDGEATALAFPLDRSKRYFTVLAALCEPRLRGEPYAPLPTVDQVVERLRPVWPAANRAAVQWNIDYLAVKLRLKPGPDSCESGPRLNGKKDTLVALALRFDLVREDDLDALRPAAKGAPR
ncbi:FHA domain-containing protein [Streptomyces sp. NBC_00525]|uniref:FHA domain-containing protein n=1 Tax=Streptomyces sp. NBC_00525 TaxID=2903660 RepID=UPI002E81E360|nr:FHA domain-containing protein [Streptomyces sp. NBC_00525]WUC95641.1 FHA domain-containing protein [Streptomyces sp. NBC_00525]